MGEWERVFRGVFRVRGTPATWDSRLMAACLFAGEGAAVSHDSAASLMGLMDAKGAPLIHISVPRSGRRGSDGIVIHNVRDLQPLDIMKFKNVLPVTNATRTLIDISCTSDFESLELMLDEALWKGLTRLSRLKWRLNTIGHGREGVAVLRELVEERVGQPLLQSRLETKFLRLVRNARVRLPVRQFEVVLAGRRAYIDCAYPDRMLAIELDGYRFHYGQVRFQRDRERQNALTNLGWRILRFTWKDVTERQEEVVRQLREALA